MTDKLKPFIDAPGIYDLEDEQYHADPCKVPSLSRTTAKLIVKHSPLHAWAEHPRLNPKYKPRKTSGAADVGTIVHSLLLRGIDNRAILDFKDYRTNDAKKARDDARAQGLIPILKSKNDEINAILDSLFSQLALTDHAKNAFQSTQNEKVVVWQEDDIWLRCMIDNYNDDFIYDYKTTAGSAEPEAWIKNNLFVGNHLQPPFYERGLKAIDGKNRPMLFIVQEQMPPYAISVISLPPQPLSVATEQTEFAINVWADCMRDNKWPGYDGRTHWADMPPWTINSWELKKESYGVVDEQEPDDYSPANILAG